MEGEQKDTNLLSRVVRYSVEKATMIDKLCFKILKHILHTQAIYTSYHSIMSRGGFRGGRGGGSGFAGGKARIGGVEMSWDYDPDLTVSTTPSEIFPPINFPSVRPPSTFELGAVARFRALRRRIREGPFYTGPLGDVLLGSEGKEGNAAGHGEKRKRDIDPFEDMPSWGQKYKVQARRLPRFDTREYQLRFFPKELWSTIDPSRRPGGKGVGAASKKRSDARLKRLADTGGDDLDGKADGDEDGLGVDDEEDGAAQEENLEDNFSEDDSEMGGDYNAENYFDDGENDGDMGDGGGDDGDGGGDTGDYD